MSRIPQDGSASATPSLSNVRLYSAEGSSEADKAMRQLIGHSTNEVDNHDALAFLFALFLNFEKDEGLENDAAYSSLATTLAVNETDLRSSVKDFKSGETSLYDAACHVEQRMSLPKADLPAALEVVREHADNINPILELIAAKESGGDYNIVWGGKRIDATDMSINEVIAWQRDATSNKGMASSAVGKYQIIRGTLTELRDQLGLTGDEKFDEAMQDRMAMALLERRGYSKFLSGDMDEAEFMKKISQEWASMPKDESGKSYYAGDGLNKAHATPESLLLAMRHAKAGAAQSDLQQQFHSGGVVVADAQQPDPLPFDGIGVDEVIKAAEAASREDAFMPEMISNVPQGSAI